MFALLGVVFIDLLTNHDVAWPLAMLIVLAGGLLMGLAHGLLVTRLKLQPFVVTLCGLLIYRGAARYYTADSTMRLRLWRRPRYGRLARRRPQLRRAAQLHRPDVGRR